MLIAIWLMVSCILCFLVFNLITLHIYLIKNDLTTFDFIMNKKLEKQKVRLFENYLTFMKVIRRKEEIIIGDKIIRKVLVIEKESN